MEPVLWLVAAALVLVGIAGTILPAIPGVPLVFIGLIVGASVDDFERVGWPSLILLALLTLVAIAVDFFAGVLGAKKVGASPWAIAGAALGSILGLFFGFPGLLMGPFVGAGLGEYFVLRDLRRAGKVGLATWLAMLVASATKVAIVGAMLGIFGLAWVL